MIKYAELKTKTGFVGCPAYKWREEHGNTFATDKRLQRVAFRIASK